MMMFVDAKSVLVFEYGNLELSSKTVVFDAVSS
jgi:hypothetical protein